jgi:Holliday junction resolvase-like predicted endonuclease
VVRRGDLVVFVEVKTRGGTGYGGAAAAINWCKRREIEVVAADYLFRNRLGDVSVRFDVVAIEAVMSQGGGGSSTLKMLGASTGVERVLFGGAALWCRGACLLEVPR